MLPSNPEAQQTFPHAGVSRVLQATRHLSRSCAFNLCKPQAKMSPPALLGKNGSTVRYASIFAAKYGALACYAFFVMVQARYIVRICILNIRGVFEK